MKNRKKFVSILAGVMAAVMVLSLVFSLIPMKAQAASSSELKKQINELKAQNKETQKHIDELQTQFEENENELLNTVNKKNLVEQEMNDLYAQIDNISQQLSAYALLIADKQDELDDAEKNLEELNAKHKERIRVMEEEGKLSYWSVLFKANSFSDLLDRLAMIEEIASADRRRLEEIGTAAEEVAQAQDALLLEKAELEDAKTELDDAQKKLEEKNAEAQELIKKLIASGEEYEKLLEEEHEEKKKLLDQIAKTEKEYDAAKYKEWLATSVPPTTKPHKPDHNNNGGNDGGSHQVPSSSGWLKPLKSYKITSPFGVRVHPIYGTQKMHNGVDMAAPAGTPIYASRSGKVTTATYNKSCGNYVSINHGDGFSSIYMHMTRYIVSAGTYVKAGQVIGYVGMTGAATGNHLHFGISYNGKYVNPMNYI